MSNLLVLVVATILVSCSSLEDRRNLDRLSPGYQFGKQLDQGTSRIGFIER